VLTSLDLIDIASFSGADNNSSRYQSPSIRLSKQAILELNTLSLATAYIPLSCRDFLWNSLPLLSHNTFGLHRGVWGIDCTSRQAYNVSMSWRSASTGKGHGGKLPENPVRITLSGHHSL
jgi:hypothetical protein